LKRNRILVVAGMVLYVGAFFLVGAQNAHPSAGERGYPGWFCALDTLISPWGHDARSSIGEDPVVYFSMLFSGWINPLFLITLLVALLLPKARLGSVLRVVLLLMFLAPWLVFYNMSLYPREGYFVWTLAMLMVMFAAPGVRAPRASAKIEPAVDTRAGIS